jgi:hypothetical protein
MGATSPAVIVDVGKVCYSTCLVTFWWEQLYILQKRLIVCDCGRCKKVRFCLHRVMVVDYFQEV